MVDKRWVSSGRVPEHTCPVCKRKLDAVTSISASPEPVRPKAGDICLCAYCHTVNVFNEDGSVRIATSEECASLPDWARGF
jgi:hypothetical protein